MTDFLTLLEQAMQVPPAPPPFVDENDEDEEPYDDDDEEEAEDDSSDDDDDDDDDEEEEPAPVEMTPPSWAPALQTLPPLSPPWYGKSIVVPQWEGPVVQPTEPTTPAEPKETVSMDADTKAALALITLNKAKQFLESLAPPPEPTE